MNFLGKSEYAFLGTVDVVDETKSPEQILVGIMKYEKPRIFTNTDDLLENLKTKDGGTFEFIELKDYLEQRIGRKVVLRRPT